MTYPPHLEERYEAEERLRQEFNRWAREGRAEEMERHHRRITEVTIDRLAPRPDERILDLGCGDGWACRMLAPLCPEGAIVGIDVSDEMVSLARQKSTDFDNLLFAPGSAEEIPWAEDYFTSLISVESAYFWPSLEAAAREMFRVMAFGGRFFILINVYTDNPHSRHWADVLDVPIHLLSASEWAELFRNFGFRNVETKQIPDDTPIPNDFQPGIHWRSREHREQFQRTGALLITGFKPDLPPPGPIEAQPRSEPPGEDSGPFPIVR